MKENILAKVLIWRACSIILTLITTWLYTGEVKNASSITIILHAVLIIGHYIFEKMWAQIYSSSAESKEYK